MESNVNNLYLKEKGYFIIMELLINNQDCLGELTPIMVYESGSKISLTIKEIYKRLVRGKETYVYSHVPNNDVVVRKVISAKNCGMKDVIKISLSNNTSFYCTLPNRLITYSEDYVPITHLQVWDELLEVDPSDTINIKEILPIGMRKVYRIQVGDSNNFALNAGVYSCC